MESITAEIPGYYFDHKLKRYFKIQSPIERERYGVSVDERRSKKPEEREEGSDNNIVKLIRNRASELNFIHSQLFELAVRRFNEVGVVEQDHHILSIKVDDDSGKFLSILTRHAFDQINMSSYSFTSTNGRVQFINDFMIEMNEELYNVNDICHVNDVCYIMAAVNVKALGFFKLINHSYYEQKLITPYLPAPVSSIVWDKYSMSLGGPPVALVGFHNGHFLRADVSVTGLDTVKLTHHRSSVNHLASLSESLIAGGGADGCVYIHDLRSSKNVTKLRVPPVGARRSRIVKLHPLSSARQLITSSMNSKMLLWDLRFNDILISFPNFENSHSFTSSLLDPQENFLVAVDDNYDVMFWSLASGRVIHKLRPEGRTRPLISYTPHLFNPCGSPTLLIAQEAELSLYSLKGF